MDINEFNFKSNQILSELEDLIHTLPIKGNTSETCQRTYLQQLINQLYYGINGTTQKDLENE